MKANFEKGTRVCSKCKRKLPIEMFDKRKSVPDGLQYYCKECKKYAKKYAYVFNGEHKICRGRSNIEKRDYELTQEQLIKRERNRMYRSPKNKNSNAHGILVWYSEKLNELDNESYRKIYKAEYQRQQRCAVFGHIGRKNPSEHFLFDFDLEQMLNDNVHLKNGKYIEYITKWWDGEIHHWTVNDGIWKKENSNEVKKEENSMSNNKNIKIINKKEETLFSQLKEGDCFILKDDSKSELYMKIYEVHLTKEILLCNSVNLNNGTTRLLGSVDEITKVNVDITARVQ